MSAETAIVYMLSNDATVNGIIAGRIAQAPTPDKISRPNVIYQRITYKPTMSNDGDAGLGWPLIQVSSYADTAAVARQLADAVKKALNGKAGSFGGQTVQSIIIRDDRDAPQPVINGQAQGVPGVIQLYQVAANE
jgi:hypothetical protein